MVRTSATDLRSHLYSYLDQVLATGEPLEIERKGRVLRIISDRPSSRLDRLPRRDTIVGDPDALAEHSWENLWQPDAGLEP